MTGHDVRVTLVVDLDAELGDSLDLSLHAGIAPLRRMHHLAAGWGSKIILDRVSCSVRVGRLDQDGMPPRIAYGANFPRAARRTIVVERSGDSISFFCDGREVHRWNDPFPITGENRNEIALRWWKGSTRLKRMTVEARRPGSLVSPLNGPEELVRHGHHDQATEAYGRLARQFPDSPTGEEALYRAVLLAARPQAPDDGKLNQLVSRFLESYPDSLRKPEINAAEARHRWARREWNLAMDLAASSTERFPESTAFSDLLQNLRWPLPLSVQQHLLDGASRSRLPDSLDLSWAAVPVDIRAFSTRNLAARLPNRGAVPDLSRAAFDTLDFRTSERGAEGGVVDLGRLVSPSLRSLSISGGKGQIWSVRTTGLAGLQGPMLEHLGAIRPIDGRLDGMQGLSVRALGIADGLVSDLTPLTALSLKHLHAARNRITFLGPLEGMPLEQVNLIGNPIRSIGPLYGAPIQRLDLSGTQVADLSPLAQAPIRNLYLQQTQVRTLAAIDPNRLETLGIAGAPIVDVERLSSFPKLRELHCDAGQLELLLRSGPPPALREVVLTGGAVSDPGLWQLFSNWPLERLSVRHVSGFDPVWMPSRTLREISMFGVGTLDARVVADGPLQQLFLDGGIEHAEALESVTLVMLMASGFNPQRLSVERLGMVGSLEPHAVQDLTWMRGSKLRRLYGAYWPLRSLDGLQGLEIDEILMRAGHFDDFSPLSGLPLRVLEISNSPVSDLTPLAPLALSRLRAGNTRVRDLSPLADMPLRELDVSNTPVSNILPLKALPLESLDISGTTVTDLGPLVANPPPHFLFADTAMTDTTLQQLAMTWEQTAEHRHHATAARVLLAQRNDAAADLRRFATTIGGKDYLVYPRRLTWPQAQALAVRLGTELIAPTSMQEVWPLMELRGLLRSEIWIDLQHDGEVWRKPDGSAAKLQLPRQKRRGLRHDWPLVLGQVLQSARASERKRVILTWPRSEEP